MEKTQKVFPGVSLGKINFAPRPPPATPRAVQALAKYPKCPRHGLARKTSQQLMQMSRGFFSHISLQHS